MQAVVYGLGCSGGSWAAQPGGREERPWWHCIEKRDWSIGGLAERQVFADILGDKGSCKSMVINDYIIQVTFADTSADDTFPGWVEKKKKNLSK